MFSFTIRLPRRKKRVRITILPRTERPVKLTKKPLSIESGAREAEAALEAAQKRIEQLQRLDIERVAAESLSAPVDLWLNGNGVEAYLDDDGKFDVERVREDAQLLVTERPGLRKLSPATDPTQGSGGSPGKSQPGWSDLLYLGV